MRPATGCGGFGDRKLYNRTTNNRPHLSAARIPTNNRMERAIRPAVVARKISCGNKTELGSRTKEILISLLATAHQTGRDFLAGLTDLLNPTATTAVPAG